MLHYSFFSLGALLEDISYRFWHGAIVPTDMVYAVDLDEINWSIAHEENQ